MQNGAFLGSGVEVVLLHRYRYCGYNGGMDTLELISKLKPNPKNPRKIDEKDFERLKKSISEFPAMLELRPIIYDEEYIVLGGNMRLKAITELVREGFTVQPEYLKAAKDLTEAQKREFVIKDNVPNGDWDMDILKSDWGDLPLEEWGLPKDDWDKKEAKEAATPEMTTDAPLSELGKVYQLGRHRLMCGDSLNIVNVAQVLANNKPTLFMGDPPYGMRLETDYSAMHGFGRGRKHEEVAGDHEDFDAKPVRDIVKAIKEQVWFGADYYAQSLGDTQHTGSWSVWDKRVEESQDGGFGSCFELMWMSQRHKRMIYRFQWAGFFTEGEKRDFDHPTEKSVRLIAKLVEELSEENDTVLDLFGGGGTTLIACEQMGRTCCMMELEPKYVDLIRKRYWKVTHDDNEEGWEAGTPAV